MKLENRTNFHNFTKKAHKTNTTFGLQCTTSTPIASTKCLIVENAH